MVLSLYIYLLHNICIREKKMNYLIFTIGDIDFKLTLPVFLNILVILFFVILNNYFWGGKNESNSDM